jgi:phosphatidylglycerol:prolipoprotein diacylglycerol transferase
LAIWGGLLGGLIALAVFAWRRRLSLPFLADGTVAGLVLAQPVARVASLITGDTIGKPRACPYGLAYANPAAMVSRPNVFHTPTPAYEILLNLAMFFIITRLATKRLPSGAISLITCCTTPPVAS